MSDKSTWAADYQMIGTLHPTGHARLAVPTADFMSSSSMPLPPTQATLAIARKQLEIDRYAVRRLSDKIQAAEDDLARRVEESRRAIREMEKERAVLEEKVATTLDYVSPIKRLPQELLRTIFVMNFEEYPCCAWVLSAVCSSWRWLALSMPKLWSKIRLVTTQTASADTIRLWLERSGRTVPLDIEIFVRSSSPAVIDMPPRRRRSPGGPHMPDFAYATPGWATPPLPALVHAGGGHLGQLLQVPHATTIQLLPGGPVVVAGAVVSQDEWTVETAASEERPLMPTPTRSRKSTQSWGHIALFYLCEQMHRWERFVFRADKHFTSIGALGAIEGDAPLLREFEVSCADGTFYNDWKWLPSAAANSTYNVFNLQHLTLNNVPFKWCAPMLTGLRSLSLRTLHTMRLELDRVLYIVASNPELEALTLHFVSLHPPVLPMSVTTMHSLKTLNLSGNHLLSTFVDHLTLPALESLVLDIEAQDPIEDTVSALFARSNAPPLAHLSLAYGPYYGGVTSWAFLQDLDHLISLHVGSAPLEPLLQMLGSDDDGPVQSLVCPNLSTLALRGCQHTHGDTVARLVQMVQARNPAPGHSQGPAPPARLRRLELHECTTLGPDVVKWLRDHVDEVVCSEPLFEGSSRSPPPYPYF